jgi:hypothetical protein
MSHITEFAFNDDGSKIAVLKAREPTEYVYYSILLLMSVELFDFGLDETFPADMRMHLQRQCALARLETVHCRRHYFRTPGCHKFPTTVKRSTMDRGQPLRYFKGNAHALPLYCFSNC